LSIFLAGTSALYDANLEAGEEQQADAEIFRWESNCAADP